MNRPLRDETKKSLQVLLDQEVSMMRPTLYPAVLLALLSVSATPAIGEERRPPPPIVIEDCVRSLCGCYSDHSLEVLLQVTDAQDEPIPYATLVCYDAGTLLGAADQDGLIKMKVDGEVSPGCGFHPACRIAYVSNQNGGYGRLIWFGRTLKGNDASTEKVERVDIADKKSD
jgi:hypothetical protein